MLLTFLQRYSLWLFLLLSGLTGLALGQLCAAYFGFVNEPAPLVSPTQQQTPQVRPRADLASYGIITRHNIFSSTQRSEPQTAVAAETPRVSTDSKWVLIGTVSGGEFPLATLAGKSQLLTLGLEGELPDGGVLSKIERNRVEISYASGKTVVLVPQEGAEAEVKSRARRNPGSNQSGGRINSLGDNRWLIPAMVADEARENVGDLLKQARAVPVLEAGQTTGFKLLMVRPRSLIAQLGLKRGDILRQVNGLALDSPEKALQIFAQLRQAKQLQIDLERKGKSMTFAYEIR